jgi:heme/copper-type cytochrome/quinol oxidase subunit 3
VNDHNPLWTVAPDDSGPAYGQFGLLHERRETLGTSLLDAVPEQRVILGGPTIIPLLTALAVAFTFVAMMIDLVLVPIGALMVFFLIVAWHWPQPEDWPMSNARAGPPGALPTSIVSSSQGVRPPIWWGMLFLLLIEGVVFASLISTYFYLRSAAEVWPLGNIERPELLLPSINALILLASSVPIYFADQGIRKGNRTRLKLGLIISFLLGATFLVLKFIEYSNLDYNWATNAYGSIVWTITGFHSAHVFSLLLKTVVIGVLAFQGYFNEERNVGVQVNGLYWHFVVLVWIPLFATIYLSPYVL